MQSAPTKSQPQWAAHAVGADTKIRQVESLHDGSSPWLLTLDTSAGIQEVVLRVAGWIEPAGIVTGAVALQVAKDRELSAPRLIAADLDGHRTGTPATLETFLRGTGLPSVITNRHLQSFGAMVARVHGVRIEPTVELPTRVRPVQVDDYAMERRWSNLYRATAPSDRPSVTRALSNLTGWTY